MGRSLGRGKVLHQTQIRLADHADLTVRPRQAGRPLNRVVAVSALMDKRIKLALRTKTTPGVLDHHDIAARREIVLLGQRHIDALVIRRADHQNGKPSVRIRPVHIRVERYSVTRLHGDICVCNNAIAGLAGLWARHGSLLCVWWTSIRPVSVPC